MIDVLIRPCIRYFQRRWIQMNNSIFVKDLVKGRVWGWGGKRLQEISGWLNKVYDEPGQMIVHVPHNHCKSILEWSIVLRMVLCQSPYHVMKRMSRQRQKWMIFLTLFCIQHCSFDGWCCGSREPRRMHILGETNRVLQEGYVDDTSWLWMMNVRPRRKK